MKRTKQNDLTVEPLSQMSEPKLVREIEIFLADKYYFRYNIITGCLEYKESPASDFRTATDYEINSILRGLHNKKHKISLSALRNILFSDFSAEYNPFMEYINSLPKWDGKTDYIQNLAGTVKTTNDDLWYTCFKRWFVALVGSMVEDEVINHTVVIFVGGQGIGKTTWLKNLVPSQLQRYFYSGIIDPTNKDAMIQLSECLLINLDELETLNRSEIGSLKDLITKPSIRVRRPYGHVAEYLVRRASFTGSVNQVNFLTDVTGSRRFLCFDVKHINYQHGLDVSLAYSQALSLFKSGFQHWFDQEEIRAITENNEIFRARTIEEELLDEFYEPCEKHDATGLFTTTMLFGAIQQNKEHLAMSNAAVQRLGKALHARKFKQFKQGGSNVWAVKLKDK